MLCNIEVLFFCFLNLRCAVHCNNYSEVDSSDGKDLIAFWFDCGRWAVCVVVIKFDAQDLKLFYCCLILKLILIIEIVIEAALLLKILR